MVGERPMENPESVKWKNYNISLSDEVRVMSDEEFADVLTCVLQFKDLDGLVSWKIQTNSYTAYHQAKE